MAAGASCFHVQGNWSLQLPERQETKVSSYKKDRKPNPPATRKTGLGVSNYAAFLDALASHVSGYLTEWVSEWLFSTVSPTLLYSDNQDYPDYPDSPDSPDCADCQYLVFSFSFLIFLVIIFSCEFRKTQRRSMRILTILTAFSNSASCLTRHNQFV